MDKTSIIGLILGLIAVGVGMVLKGVGVTALINPAALLIIILGTVAAALVITVLGVFYFNTSEELTTKKGVISSKPLVFVSSIDSSRLSDDDKKYVEGITGNVISSLSKSKSIRLVPTKTVQSFEKNEISSEQLFKTHGIKFLVSSSLQ